MSKIVMRIPAEQLKKFNTALLMYNKGFKKEASRTMVEHGRLLVKDLIKWTPPQKGKKEGERAVERDLRNAVTPYSDKSITDPKLSKRMKEIVNRNDIMAGEAIFENIPGMKKWKIVPFSPTLHESVRVHGNRLRVSKSKNIMTFELNLWKSYFKTIKERVGRLKASWLPAAEKLSISVADWIQRHTDYGHSVTTCNLVLGESPRMVIWNGSKAGGYLRHAAETALTIRTRNMARDLAYKIKYMRNQLLKGGR